MLLFINLPNIYLSLAMCQEPCILGKVKTKGAHIIELAAEIKLPAFCTVSAGTEGSRVP